MEIVKILGTVKPVGIDQTTQGVTNAVYPVETSVILDLVLSTDTSVYATGDVLANTQELVNAVRANGGTSMLQSLTLYDADDQGQAMDIVFMKTNVSLGTENAAVSISDVDAIEILGIVSIGASDWIDLGGVRVATTAVTPILVQAATASTSIYVGAISRGTGTYTASGLALKIGIVRL